VTIPFVVPPFLIVTAVTVVSARYQGLGVVQDIFFGVGPVMAIAAIAAYKLACDSVYSADIKAGLELLSSSTATEAEAAQVRSVTKERTFEKRAPLVGRKAF
jgi:chromate transport protein ChrA